MGLLKISSNSIKSKFNEEENYIYCNKLEDDVIIKECIISKEINNKTNIIVDDEQCLLVVNNDKIIDFTTEAGVYNFDKDKELLKNNKGFESLLLDSFDKYKAEDVSNIKFYFINVKIIKGSIFKTKDIISYKDNKLGINVNIKCYGKYDIKIIDPILLYISSYENIDKEYKIDNKFKEELLNNFLQVLPNLLEKLSNNEISYDMIVESNKELNKIVEELMLEKYKEKGINITNLLISSVVPTNESMKEIKKNIEEQKEKIIQQEVIEEKERKCKNCGTIVDENSKFCPQCGEKL